MGLFHSYETSSGYVVNVISNSSIQDFNYFESNKTVRMEVSSMTADQTFGFCRVSIPHALMDNPNVVRIVIDNGKTKVLFENATLYDNGTCRWIYFAYASSAREITVQSDTTPPTISILSPQNKVYSVNNVNLTFTLSEYASWMAYSLDDKANVTITGNTTLTGLGGGSHTLKIYAEDPAGNTGASETIQFSITQKTHPIPTLWIITTIIIIVVIAAVAATLTIHHTKTKKTKQPQN
jgi:multisubunit Na+/H+ antiporter MnhC subunit